MAADEKPAVPAAASDNQIDETLRFSPEEEAVSSPIPPFFLTYLPSLSSTDHGYLLQQANHALLTHVSRAM